MKTSYTVNKVKDIILMGDINEHVEEKSITNFMNENGLVNIHKHINNFENNNLDNTFKYGTKCIDIIMCTYGLIEYVAGCQLIECDEVVLNDHRGYLLDIKVERYCQCKLNKYN